MPTATGKQAKPKKNYIPPRKRSFDTSGLLVPYPEEVAEGAAWIVYNLNPTEGNRQALSAAWNALSAVVPHPGLFRCPECGTRKYGRGQADPCGHCGAIERP